MGFTNNDVIEVSNVELQDAVYYGDCEEFLLKTNYDEELIEILNKLYESDKDSISFFGHLGLEYIITKVKEEDE